MINDRIILMMVSADIKRELFPWKYQVAGVVTYVQHLNQLHEPLIVYLLRLLCLQVYKYDWDGKEKAENGNEEYDEYHYIDNHSEYSTDYFSDDVPKDIDYPKETAQQKCEYCKSNGLRCLSYVHCCCHFGCRLSSSTILSILPYNILRSAVLSITLYSLHCPYWLTRNVLSMSEKSNRHPCNGIALLK